MSTVKHLSALRPLTESHDLDGFDCGEPALDDWLTQPALENESRLSRTYVICDENKVVAYFCIAAGAVSRSSVSGSMRRNVPDTIPVSVIGRLAVSRAYAGRGLGAEILADALLRIAVASQSIGIRAVLVQAKDEKAKRFYMACAEFMEYPAESCTLFLATKTAIAAFC